MPFYSKRSFVGRTFVGATTKLSVENETPPIANVLLAAAIFFHEGFLLYVCDVDSLKFVLYFCYSEKLVMVFPS